MLRQSNISSKLLDRMGHLTCGFQRLNMRRLSSMHRLSRTPPRMLGVTAGEWRAVPVRDSLKYAKRQGLSGPVRCAVRQHRWSRAPAIRRKIEGESVATTAQHSGCQRRARAMHACGQADRRVSSRAASVGRAARSVREPGEAHTSAKYGHTYAWAKPSGVEPALDPGEGGRVT